ncbi:Exo-beta-D-glucosaminidase precursor [Eubacteriaceae bacterium CHKCI005]|nr:Exo-beta-D-glucosaminidase precursor [Eubacteriaceae bacterium CHKCI005]
MKLGKTGQKRSFQTRGLAVLLSAVMAASALIGSIGAVSAAEPEDKGENLALHKDVLASTVEKAEHDAPLAVDGDNGTRWASAEWNPYPGTEDKKGNDPQWFQVDLGQLETVSRVTLSWETAYSNVYRIQVSQDGEDWTTVYNTFKGDGGIDDIFFAPQKARYVRMIGTARGTFYGYSLYEFEVYGPKNSAQGTKAEVSSNEEQAGNLTDGDTSTAWTSAEKTGQSATVDLGDERTVGSVILDWGENYASSYAVYISDDNASWKQVYTTDRGQGGREIVNIAPLENTHYAVNNEENVYVAQQSARYIRVVPTAGNGDSYAINEIEVYGNPTEEEVAVNDDTIKEDMSLNDGWTLARAPDVTATAQEISSVGFDDSSWIPATVPGTVLTSYYEAGLIDDPYYSDNMDQLDQDYYNVDYWYRKDVEIPADYAGQRMLLNFDAINWQSDIFINGQKVGIMRGAFDQGEFDVSQYLIPGETNTIAVNVHIYPTATQETDWTPNFICSGGWDWMPPIPGRNIGIYKDVYLSTKKEVSVDAPFVVTDLPLPDTDSADIRVSTDLVNDSSKDITGTLKGVIQPVGVDDAAPITFEKEITIPATTTSAVTVDQEDFPQLHVEDPLLWWPNGYGDQNLYNMNLSFEIDGKVSDVQNFNFGIREYSYDYALTTEVKEGEEPYDMQISCNGVRILCKGGNWGMPDAMLSWDDEDYDTAVKMHKDMNFNMIRTWHGTSDFEAFYDACDKYGIMVYEDFWLNGFLTPKDCGSFLDNAEIKFERLRNRACIALWCGENEATPPWPLEVLLPELAEKMDDSRMYIQRSNKAITNGEIEIDSEMSGGITYAVMDPSWYFEQAKQSLGFVTEIGTPVVPNVETMKSMMDEEDLWPVRDPDGSWGKRINDMWQYHDLGGSSDIGNKGAEKYLDEIDKRYGVAQNVEEFCTLAQMLNLETNKAMFEAWNQEMWENSSGLLLWMSQSAWPSTVWQTYDSSFDVNGAYFGCKVGSEPIHIQWSALDNEVKIINNTTDVLNPVVASAYIYDMNGVQKADIHATLAAAANDDTLAFDLTDTLEDAAFAGITDVSFIKLTLRDIDGNLLSENFYWRNKDGSTNYTAMQEIPDVELTASDFSEETVDGHTTMTVTLTNDTDSVAVMTRLKVMQKKSAERVLPTYYSDNYFALLPGESKTVTVEFDEEDTNGQEAILQMEGFNTTVKGINGEAVTEPEPEPTATITSDKAEYEVEEPITMTIVTQKEVERVGLYNENGKGMGLSNITSRLNKEGLKEWTVTMTVGTAGRDRTFDLYLRQNGQWTDSYANLVVSIGVTPVDPEVTPAIYEAFFDVDSAVVNEPFTAKVETSTSIAKLGIKNERGKWITHEVLGYTDQGDKRIWKVSLSVGSVGNRIFSFTGYDADNTVLDYTVEDSIVIQKANTP